jgi:hypothetical protein
MILNQKFDLLIKLKKVFLEKKSNNTPSLVPGYGTKTFESQPWDLFKHRKNFEN